MASFRIGRVRWVIIIVVALLYGGGEGGRQGEIDISSRVSQAACTVAGFKTSMNKLLAIFPPGKSPRELMFTVLRSSVYAQDFPWLPGGAKGA